YFAEYAGGGYPRDYGWMVPRNLLNQSINAKAPLYHVEAGIRLRELAWRLDHPVRVSEPFADGYFAFNEGRWWWYNNNGAGNGPGPDYRLWFKNYGDGFRHFIFDTGFWPAFGEFDQSGPDFEWAVTSQFGVKFVDVTPEKTGRWAL